MDDKTKNLLIEIAGVLQLIQRGYINSHIQKEASGLLEKIGQLFTEECGHDIR